ncbi:MAG: hypothetical protein M3494_13205 [Actinomycetota bacterium]|jgi:hypothetical protein|nr:hypothetical protein [Rubrobacter sp.]MDQ3508951.1 hypothetical protein [Actinomycetota bacterium]
MHDTFDELREAYPGKWLLIRTDGTEAETGTLLFVHEDPKVVGKALVDEPDRELDKERPLYTTYSFAPEDEFLSLTL